jgi:hypothetical protein
VWRSLRRVFDIALDYVEDPHQRARNDAMEEIVRRTPQLHARYPEKMQRVQQLLIGRVAVRLAGADAAPSSPEPAAIVGAAFACMQAARQAWSASDRSEPFDDYLDRAMAVFQIDATRARQPGRREQSPLAEDGGFEPPRVSPTRFPSERHRPLGESSVVNRTERRRDR